MQIICLSIIKRYFLSYLIALVSVFQLNHCYFPLHFVKKLFQPQQEKVYSSYLNLDLADVEPCLSGPKRYFPGLDKF